jgi:hypothetical protein
MKIKNLLTYTLLLLLTPNLHAQNIENKKNTKPVAKTETWSAYDSLGDSFLFSGDTSSAIYCYEKAQELDTSKSGNNKSLDKLKRCYHKTAQSFYLKEN